MQHFSNVLVMSVFEAFLRPVQPVQPEDMFWVMFWVIIKAFTKACPFGEVNHTVFKASIDDISAWQGRSFVSISFWPFFTKTATLLT
jgi:hypothetical protein